MEEVVELSSEARRLLGSWGSEAEDGWHVYPLWTIWHSPLCPTSEYQAFLLAAVAES